MTQDYHITMDGGKRFLTICSESASNAMGLALERNRGYRVTSCYAGGNPNTGQSGDWSARLDFEVPKHDPLPFIDKVKLTKPACELFDDAEIQEESKRAKIRHGEK